jgi:hypothetical protein
MFKVMKTDGETGEKTQVGAVRRTEDEAATLKALMRTDQEPGSSDSFSIERV